MEVFRQHGMADAIIKRAGNMSRISQVSWVTTLGGESPWDRKRIASVPTFGGGDNSTQSNPYM
jgi:2,4-dichlorophenol 6-monooxygenase